MILFLRADSPEVTVEIAQKGVVIGSKQWQAGREFSTQIHQVIDELCSRAGETIKAIKGIVVYEGPGSYTGLRVSVSVANALGYSLSVPIIGATAEGWRQKGATKLASKSEFSPVSPVYGGQVYTTQPKK